MIHENENEDKKKLIEKCYSEANEQSSKQIFFELCIIPKLFPQFLKIQTTYIPMPVSVVRTFVL